jgi:hypothetical protein
MEKFPIFRFLVKQGFHAILLFLEFVVHFSPILLDFNQLIYSFGDVIRLLLRVLPNIHYRQSEIYGEDYVGTVHHLDRRHSKLFLSADSIFP